MCASRPVQSLAAGGMLSSCCGSGGDYITASRVEEYHKQIRKRLGQRLEYCGGNVVVLFDELQKAAPGTLDGERMVLVLHTFLPLSLYICSHSSTLMRFYVGGNERDGI